MTTPACFRSACVTGAVALMVAACAARDGPAAPGYATILTAPASAAPSHPVRPAGAAPLEVDLANPDADTTRDAMALDRRLRAEGDPDYVGMRIVRDPAPRYAFQFSRDATSRLSHVTQDARFLAIDGGLPRDELQPLFDVWWARFAPHRIAGAGAVMEFDGVVQIQLTIDQAQFETLSAAQGWSIPERVQLLYAPRANPHAADPGLASQVRVFPREDRLPAAVLQAALSGRLILRDGCFRLQDHGDGGEPLVLFGRDVELRRDAEGYLVVIDPHGRQARVGERIVWSGPRGVIDDAAGVLALRAACGSEPIVAVGEPESAVRFGARRAG
ncbi:hypothetical protein [Brevundimonas sp.]|uniref:hypothetical protein n=1 Tax=Brevundimonas sp. TaxID=1871086 RepID=UPI00289BF6F9|nr:hypothetical protein [Brevundimonas sp.]